MTYEGIIALLRQRFSTEPDIENLSIEYAQEAYDQEEEMYENMTEEQIAEDFGLYLQAIAE